MSLNRVSPISDPAHYTDSPYTTPYTLEIVRLRQGFDFGEYGIAEREQPAEQGKQGQVRFDERIQNREESHRTHNP